MAWNGSGTYSRTNGTNSGATTWADDATAGTKITASNHDTHDEDIATAINACLTKNNETKPTAHFQPNADATYDLGQSAKQWKDVYFSGNLVGSAVTLGTEKASTSGTSVDFTSIPAWVQRITILFVGVSTSGTDTWRVQLGDSGGVETTGYLGAGASISDSNVANYTDGFGWPFAAATNIVHGAITLFLENSSSNTWVASGTVCTSQAAAAATVTGRKALSGTLDRVRITTSLGSDTFDAGAINIQYS